MTWALAGIVELPDGSAVVELATAAELHLGRGGDPAHATTHGVGTLLAETLHRRARRLVLCVGGPRPPTALRARPSRSARCCATGAD
jgi:hypothetical protein